MSTNTCCGTTDRTLSTHQNTAECCSADRGREAPLAAKAVSCFKPDVDVAERPDAFVVTADLPGATAENIAIDFDNGALTVTARIEPRQRSGARVLLGEYGVGDYRRVFRIGEAIEPGGIEASFDSGVLRITLPKAATARQRTIKVNVA